MSAFAECTVCKVAWEDRDRFLADPAIRLIGYQSHFANLRKGLLLFAHEPCQTSLALEVAPFEDLYAGPFWDVRMTGKEACPGYCLDRDNLGVCQAECECRWVREVVGILAKR